MKKIIQRLMLLSILFASASCGSMKNMNHSQPISLFDNDQLSITFEADYVIPSSTLFKPRYLTSEYTVSISNDTLISHLPYFGEAYYATYGSTESPLSFRSTQFTYSVERNDKKALSKVNIQILDQSFSIIYYFTIFDNGRSDLLVSDSSRKNIIYRGNIVYKE